MKLLYVLPEYVNDAGGGIITFYRHLLPRIAAEGHEVRVIVGSGVTAADSPCINVIDGVKIEVLERALLERNLLRFARYSSMPGLRRHLAGAWAAWEQARRGEPCDVVEAADWGLLFLPWVVEQGPAAVVQLHGSVGQIAKHDPVRGEEAQGCLIALLERLGLAQACAAQAYSRANAGAWERQAGRTVERILPAWQPLVGDDATTRRTSRGLVVGRVQRWKGPEVLCQALRLLGSLAPPMDWMGRDTAFLSRDSRTTAHLRQQWPDIWDRVVTHHPQQGFEATAGLQRRAAFMVVPSLWDTFNFTCVEAMGAGTPVICSTGAGASELVEDGVNGFVFENGDPASLARALERLLALGEPDRAAIGEAGRRTALRELEPSRVCRQRLEAYAAAQTAGAQGGLPADDWLREACAPEPEGSAGSLHFLDHLPLKKLVTYSARRALQKVWR